MNKQPSTVFHLDKDTLIAVLYKQPL